MTSHQHLTIARSMAARSARSTRRDPRLDMAGIAAAVLATVMLLASLPVAAAVPASTAAPAPTAAPQPTPMPGF